MGALALYLAERFEQHRRPSWTIGREQRLDFDPRVDVLLEGPDGRRVAVEFEVSRADPVANQVKFLLAAARARSARAGRSKRRSKRVQSSSRHRSTSEPGATTTQVRRRPRARISVMSRPAMMVLPAPGSSASAKRKGRCGRRVS